MPTTIAEQLKHFTDATLQNELRRRDIERQRARERDASDGRIRPVQFEMYTPAGNAAAKWLAERVGRLIASGDCCREGAVSKLREGMAEIAVKHGEIYDTEPEFALCDALADLCRARGWEPIDRFEDF